MPNTWRSSVKLCVQAAAFGIVALLAGWTIGCHRSPGDPEVPFVSDSNGCIAPDPSVVVIGTGRYQDRVKKFKIDVEEAAHICHEAREAKKWHGVAHSVIDGDWYVFSSMSKGYSSLCGIYVNGMTGEAMLVSERGREIDWSVNGHIVSRGDFRLAAPLRRHYNC